MKKSDHILSRFNNDQDGSIAILFALTLVAVTGATGMAVDFGRALTAKTQLQNAVDAAAMAGAALPATANANRYDVALKIFNSNLATSDLSSTVPTIEATNSGVTVTASSNIKTTFANALGVEKLQFTSSSTARSQVQNGGVVCMLALSPTAADGLHLQGVNKVQSEDCWAWVNSNHESSINATGASSGSGQGFCTHGQVVGGSHFTPTPYTGCDRMSDPFVAQINAHNVSMTCDHEDVQLKSGTHTLQPGVYCGDTVFKPQADVTLAAGTYVFRDGELQVQAGASLTGTGVTLFFVGQDTRMEVRGGANIDIKAPTTGELAGFAIVDRVYTWYDTSIRETVIQGGGRIKIEGILYAPQWRMNISGNGQLNEESKFFAMIADHFYMEGNGKIFVKSDAAGAGMPEIMPKIKNGPLLLN